MMIRHPFARPLAALLLGCCLPPAPVAASDYVKPLVPNRTIDMVRMAGTWKSADGNTLEVSGDGAAMRVILRKVDRAGRVLEELAVPLNGAGASVDGVWSHDGKSGRFDLQVSQSSATARPTLKLVKTMGDDPIVAPGHYYSPGFTDLTGDLARYAGRWAVKGGFITFTVEGDRLAGQNVMGPDGGIQQQTERFLFSPFLKSGNGRMLGAWAAVPGGNGDEASLEFTSDGAKLMLREMRYGNERVDLLTRVDNGAGRASSPPMTLGSAARKPGYTLCGKWCEFKIVSATNEAASFGTNGQFVRHQMTLKLHNISAQAVTLQGDAGGATGKGNFRVAYRTLNNYESGFISPARVSADPGAVSYDEFAPIPRLTLPAGAEAEIRVVNFFPPQAVKDLVLRTNVDGPSEVVIPHARFYCDFWTMVNGQIAQNISAYGYKAIPAERCDAVPAQGGMPTDLPGDTPVAPAPVAAPVASAPALEPAMATTASGAAMPTAGAASAVNAAPSAGSADGFLPLGKVAVRLESTARRDDGRTEVVLMVRNTSPGLYYLTSGNIILFAEDADGMSNQAGAPYRAGIEPPPLFSSTPVIQPGSQMRARWLIRGEADVPVVAIHATESGRRVQLK